MHNENCFAFFFLVCVQKWELTSKISSITHNKRTNHLKIEFCAGAIKIITQKATKNDVWKNNSNRNKNKNLMIIYSVVLSFSRYIRMKRRENETHTHFFLSIYYYCTPRAITWLSSFQYGFKLIQSNERTTTNIKTHLTRCTVRDSKQVHDTRIQAKARSTTQRRWVNTLSFISRHIQWLRVMQGSNRNLLARLSKCT